MVQGGAQERQDGAVAAHPVKRTALLVALLVTCSAHADLGPPYITPAHPTRSDTIVLHALQDACNLFNSGLIPPQVTQSGGTIDVLVTGDHQGDPEFCIYGTVMANVPVGAFSPGSYTMRVTWQYFGIGGTLEQHPLGEVEFAVVPDQSSGTIIAAPTINSIGAGVLVSVLSILVWRHRRRRDLGASGKSSSDDSPAGPTSSIRCGSLLR